MASYIALSDTVPLLPASAHGQIDTGVSSITVLVNKDFPLPESYVPEDLVVPDILFIFNFYNEKKLMRRDASNALERLFAASERAGLSLTAISGYRSYERQKQIYLENVRARGLERTSLFSAMPGCSEHQSGLAMDVSAPSISNRLEEVFSGTPEGIWLAETAHLYGFVIRYQKDKVQITGYAHEPWHIRYVGVDLAEILYKGSMSLEEYYSRTPSPENAIVSEITNPAVSSSPKQDEQLSIFETEISVLPSPSAASPETSPEPILNTAAPEVSQD